MSADLSPVLTSGTARAVINANRPDSNVAVCEADQQRTDGCMFSVRRLEYQESTRPHCAGHPSMASAAMHSENAELPFLPKKPLLPDDIATNGRRGKMFWASDGQLLSLQKEPPDGVRNPAKTLVDVAFRRSFTTIPPQLSLYGNAYARIRFEQASIAAHSTIVGTRSSEWIPPSGFAERVVSKPGMG